MTAKHRLPGLDGVRAFAVAWVILLHAGYSVTYPGWFAGFASRGVHGVTVFFVLSGFLITWLLLEEEQRLGAFSLRDFYVRRAFRILPPVFLFLLGLAVASALVPLEIPVLDWLGCLFFFRNLTGGSYYTAHFWSLAIEEQFYLLWPLLLFLTPRRARLPVTAGLCALAPVWRQANMMFFGAQNLNWSRADLLYDALLVGALLALAQRYSGFRKCLAGAEWRAYAAFAGGVLLVVVALALPLPKYLLPLRIPLELAGIALVLKVLVEGRAPGVQRVFQWPPAEWIGRISYSLYLWQQVFLPKEPLAVWQQLPWNIPLAVGFAFASFHFVERPALRWRERFLKGRAPVGPVESPP
ncbi:MAG: acyltransferase family protein [Limisphaerales bacterium]